MLIASTIATAKAVLFWEEDRVLFNNRRAFSRFWQSKMTVSKRSVVTFLTAAKISKHGSTLMPNSPRTMFMAPAVFSSAQSKSA